MKLDTNGCPLHVLFIYNAQGAFAVKSQEGGGPHGGPGPEGSAGVDFKGL